MPMPETVRDMLRAGYQRLKDGTCRGCGAPIAWFKTTKGALMPVNLPIVNDYTRVDPHWVSNLNGEEIRHELITAANQVRWNINSPIDKGVSA